MKKISNKNILKTKTKKIEAGKFQGSLDCKKTRHMFWCTCVISALGR
jgi:molybdopterin-binding protein